MKYLIALLLFVLACPFDIEAQQTAIGKAAVEIAASSSTGVVKGAPFSAEAVSESLQMLADGNKISRSHSTKMFRDSEGRFRREGGSGAGGIGFAYTTAISTNGDFGSFQDSISIFDPVANVRYFLSPSTKTARRINLVSGTVNTGFAVGGQSFAYTMKSSNQNDPAKKADAEKPQIIVLNGIATTIARGEGGSVSVAYGNPANIKSEQLGTRDFEGVTAEGTRTVTTIPANAIGNERPIEIVYERWYSKDLQMIVYSKQSDPRFGEQTYRLTNISRSEPDRSLFILPTDYKIVSEPTFNVVTTTKPQ